ncbi:MAG: peptidyl-prolyl cis-trans isomerase [Fimbriimonadales bacterium]|nr:peptidyl-prolyl cis-trans isomerase [Fimbriimonadales bacterium]
MFKILAFLVAVSSASLTWAQLDPNRVVATVNGEEIKAAEYYQRMEFLPGVGKRVGDRFAELPPGFMTLEQLITERLVLQLAKSKGCLPTDAEVQAEFERRRRDEPQLVERWTASGRTIPELLHDIRVNLAGFKLKTFGITITDQEVQDFYRRNPTLFTIEKRYRLRVIVVDTASRDKVDAALKAGRPFADVARESSLDLTKVEGGLVGVVPASRLNEASRKAVESVRIGQTTDWISTGDRHAKFLLEDVLPEQVLPLDARLKEDIRRRLMLDRGNVRNNVQREMTELRRKSRIDIRNPEFAEIYHRMIDSYLAQESAKAQGSKP